MANVAYLDASAIVKLVLREDETDALERDASGRSGLISSAIAGIQTRRAVRRAPSQRILKQVDAVFESFALLELTSEVMDRAGHIEPAAVRTLDAVHLATALAAEIEDLDFITYDDRLARAAEANGLTVVQPGRRKP